MALTKQHTRDQKNEDQNQYESQIKQRMTDIFSLTHTWVVTSWRKHHDSLVIHHRLHHPTQAQPNLLVCLVFHKFETTFPHVGIVHYE